MNEFGNIGRSLTEDMKGLWDIFFHGQILTLNLYTTVIFDFSQNVYIK